jgi:hypothetical protein
MSAVAVAVKTMAASGYDPAELARYVARTAKDDGVPNWQAFQAQRLAELRKGAAQAAFVPGGDGAEFARVRAMLAK